jgi:hypothetical protein
MFRIGEASAFAASCKVQRALPFSHLMSTASFPIAAVLLTALILAGCGGPQAPWREAPALEPGPQWILRKAGEACGAYPAPGEPLTKCAEGLRCDYTGAAVDGPGMCRPAQ